MFNNSTKNGAGSRYSSCLLLNTLNVWITGPAATSVLSIVISDWSAHVQVGGNRLQFYMFQSCVDSDAVHQNPPPSDMSAGWVTSCILILSGADTALVWRKWTRICAKVMQCCDHILSDQFFFCLVFRKWFINSCSVFSIVVWINSLLHTKPVKSVDGILRPPVVPWNHGGGTLRAVDCACRRSSELDFVLFLFLGGNDTKGWQKEFHGRRNGEKRVTGFGRACSPKLLLLWLMVHPETTRWSNRQHD